jgi:CheY-like chemotaxis protein
MIADIRMPDADGYVLIQTLRAIEREHSYKHLPAIALTAYATAADRDQALAAGYDLHLAKPVGPGDSHKPYPDSARAESAKLEDRASAGKGCLRRRSQREPGKHAARRV